MHVCNEQNLTGPMPRERPFGIRISLRPGDPFAKLVGPDWHREHWFATEGQRDAALSEMSGRYLFFRAGDEPALSFEKIERPAAAV